VKSEGTTRLGLTQGTPVRYRSLFRYIIVIIKVLSLAVFLAALDILFIQHACTNTITKGASVQVDQLFFFHQFNDI